MGDIIEGIVKQYHQWKNGKGWDVVLDNDFANKYFYLGKRFPYPAGKPLRIEIVKGEGEFSDKWEIINAELLDKTINPVVDKPLGHKPEPQGHMQNILMPIPALKQLLDRKHTLNQSRIEALRSAVALYAALRLRETDVKAAAHDVVEIADILEAFLT